MIDCIKECFRGRKTEYEGVDDIAPPSWSVLDAVTSPITSKICFVLTGASAMWLALPSIIGGPHQNGTASNSSTENIDPGSLTMIIASGVVIAGTPIALSVAMINRKYLNALVEKIYGAPSGDNFGQYDDYEVPLDKSSGSQGQTGFGTSQTPHNPSQKTPSDEQSAMQILEVSDTGSDD